MHRTSKPSPSKPSQPKKKLPSPESLSFISNLLHTRLGLHLDFLEQTNITVINDIRKVRTSANQLITKTASLDSKASELFMHNEPFPDLPVSMTFQTEQAVSALPVLTFGDAARNYTSYSQNDTLQDLSPVPRFSNSTNFSPDFSPERRPASRNDTHNHQQQREENKNQNGMKLDPYAFLLEAIEDLQKLTRKDVLILSSHINPAPNIKTAMDALCIILGKNSNWTSVKKMLEEPNIISHIISFNFERIDKITLQKIETFVNSPSPIDYEKLKTKSVAAAAFWKWVLAVHYYYVAVSHNEQEIIDHLKNQPQDSPKRIISHQEEDAFTELENQLDTLDQITKKVKRITKKQIDEIFAYKVPPEDVKRVVEIFCILFGEKPTWYSAKKAFQQKKILEKVDSLKLEEISEPVKEKLRELQQASSLKNQKHQQLQCIEILENYLTTVASIVCSISTKTFDEEEQELFDIHKEELTMECIQEESENYSQDRTARGPTPHQEEDFDQPEEPVIIKEALKHFIGLKKEDFALLQKSGNSHIIKTVLQGVYLAIKGPELELINLKDIKDLDFRKVTKDIDQIMTKILSYNYENKSTYIVTKLKEYLKLSNLSMEKIKKESPIALALWNWLHSIVKYHEQVKTEKLVSSSPPPKMRKSADLFHSLPNKTPPRITSSHKKLDNQSHTRIHPQPQEKEKLHLEFTNRNVNEYMKEFHFFADDFKDFKRTIGLPKPLEIVIKVYSLLTKQPYITSKNFPTRVQDLNKQMDIDPESLTENTVKTVRKEISECLIHEDQLEQISRLGLYIWKWAKILLFLHDRSVESKKPYHHQSSLESHYQSLLKAKSEISGIRQRTTSAPDISNLLDFIEAKKMVMKSLLQNSTMTPNESFHRSPDESKNFYKVAERSRSQENMIKISDLAKIARQPPSTKLYNSNEKSITLPDNFRPQTPDTSPVLHNRGGHFRNGSLPGSLQTSPTQKASIIRSEKSSPTSAKIKPRLSSTAEKARVSSANLKVVKKDDMIRHQPWKQKTPVKQKSDHFELKRPARIASSSSGIRAFTTSGEEKEPIRVNKRALRVSEDEGENISRSNQQEARENQMKRYQELMKNFQQLLKTDPDKKLKFELTEDLVQNKILSYQKNVNDLELLNKTLKNSGVSRAPIKKSFIIKSSTKKVIQLVNSQWITNLLNQRGWSDVTYNILVLLFMIYNPDIQFEDYEKLDLKENIRNFIVENQAHLGENLLEMGKYLNLQTKQKVQIEKFLQDKREVFNSTSYEKSDQFCWAISQLLKDACEHLGVLGMESARDISTKEKLFLYNQEKILYYKQKVEKLKKIEESQFGSRTSKK